MPKVPIVNYQRSITWSLLKLAESLHNQDIFGQYLSPQQLVVLNHILEIPDVKIKKAIWEQLVRGNVVLNVEKKEESVPVEETQAESDELSDNVATPNSGNKEIEAPNSEELQSETNVTDFSDLDLEELRQNTNGEDFVGNLSLKLRYVLWQFAVDAMTPDETLASDTTEYVLLGDDTDEPAEDDISGESAATNSRGKVTREDDDYDFDEEEEEGQKKEDQENFIVDAKQPGSGNINIEMETDSRGKLVVHLQISKSTLPKLRVNKTQVIVENFSKIYHNLENDRETLLKRLKLEENDKLLEYDKKRKHGDKSSENEDEDNLIDDEPDLKKHRNSISSLPVNLGVNNLSLKHLLATIQENKSKLQISDYELKHLIMEVRKNRSKWASDDKIGQEELYDACEKVVMELRNYTEHSTAFLNKVSKRDAPNYYQIIKKPMDLNTVLKKLKTFQYKSKQQFADDIMLIWKNCLTYNSDPKHFLRAHAIAMQKKSQQLIPFIPDIVVRDRHEVEKELEKEDKDDDEEEEVVGTGRKGGVVRRGVQTIRDDEEDDELPPTVEGKNVPLPERAEINSFGSENTEVSNDQPDASDSSNGSEAAKVGNTAGATKEPAPDLELTKGNLKAQEQEALPDAEEFDEQEEEEDDEDDENEMEVSQNLFEKDNGDDDLELTTWKNLTAKVRAEICMRRSELFKNGKLNSESVAMLRNPARLKDFNLILQEYRGQQKADEGRKANGRGSIMKNGFGAVIKQESSQELLPESQNMGSNLEKDADEIDIDNASLLSEYNVANSYPDIGYKGISNEMLQREEEVMIQYLLNDTKPKQSIFLANKDKGMTPLMNENIKRIYEIRHICHKISLIRMLQKPNQAKSSLLHQRLKHTSIKNDIDLDPVSQLETHDYRNNRQLIWKIMHKNVSKISMSHGFESTEPSAISALTEIAGDYLSNLVKSLKIHRETNSLNRRDPKQMLCMTLLENGINKPDDLFTYIENEFTKKAKKLNDIKTKLNGFLRDLLRPTLQDLSERNFDDESQSFMTGDFSSEITGEDFFGFRELGLEKEFGVLTSSVPLQLLTLQFRSKDAEGKEKDKKIQQDEFENVVYHKVTKESLDSGRYLKLLSPLLFKAYDRCNLYHLKMAKSKNADQVPDNHDSPSFPILEDHELPKSKGAARARLPPTGKIGSNYKKKPIGEAYFLPEEPSESPEQTKKTQNANTTGTNPQDSDPLIDKLFGSPSAEVNDVENGFGLNSASPSGSFSLSLPRVQ
ncbi:HBL190Cp [Eremothecium sinecaudum]|uniref:SAGA complex subunit Spt7 n=1 Tax=Eremothecium sinecaudum TaxID=45286 RepID=A0A109UX09_9SACH|nr:HBL190Cp [Eremothecium sinecaudum]AMD18712.1 HBL190Cp [Eremothecium sinecaudum]